MVWLWCIGRCALVYKIKTKNNNNNNHQKRREHPSIHFLPLIRGRWVGPLLSLIITHTIPQHSTLQHLLWYILIKCRLTMVQVTITHFYSFKMFRAGTASLSAYPRPALHLCHAEPHCTNSSLHQLKMGTHKYRPLNGRQRAFMHDRPQ